MKRETFAACMATLSGAFGRPLEDAAFEGYWIGLEGVTEAELIEAMRTALKKCQFMPPPSELLGFARKHRSNAARLEAMKLSEQIKREIAGPTPLRMIDEEEKP